MKFSKSSDSSDVLARAMNGDGGAIVEYMLTHFDSRVHRRVAGMLRRADVTVVGWEDVYDSAGRRVLLRCLKTGVIFSEPGNLDAYIRETLVNVTREKIRAERIRRRRIEQARRMLRPIRPAMVESAEEDLAESLLSHCKEVERRILELRLSGLRHVQIAAELNLTLQAYHTLWRALRAQVKSLVVLLTSLSAQANASAVTIHRSTTPRARGGAGAGREPTHEDQSLHHARCSVESHGRSGPESMRFV